MIETLSSGVLHSQRRTLVGSERDWVPPADRETAFSARELHSADPIVIIAIGQGDWVAPTWSRVAELAALPANWDSYGALRLQPRAVHALAATLAEVSDYINTPPIVSLTSDGGLLCEWHGATQLLGLAVAGDGEVTVQAEAEPSGEAWDAPIRAVADLGKRVWQASLYSR